MTLDFSDIIDRIKNIEHRFNKSKNPTERYALIQAINHIAKHELPIIDWLERQYYEAMLEAHGASKFIKKDNKTR